MEPAETAALLSPGELAEERRLPRERHPALDGALAWLQRSMGGGMSSYSMGEGAGHPRPDPVEFIFYHQSIFVPLVFFFFPSGYRTSSKEEGLELTLAMSQYMDIDPPVQALL